jgi:hypothetical protein
VSARSGQGTRKPLVKRTPIPSMSAKRAARLKQEGRWQPGTTFAGAAPKARTPSELPARLGLGVRAEAGAREAVKSAPKKRRDTIPRAVRALVSKRDPWCQVSGLTTRLEVHHRRPKQMGGDPRPHADCPCNLIRLTRSQHQWVHRNRREAEAMGLLLPAETKLPGSVSVMRGSADGGVTSYPTCSGEWASECPYEASEAA